MPLRILVSNFEKKPTTEQISSELSKEILSLWLVILLETLE